MLANFLVGAVYSAGMLVVLLAIELFARRGNTAHEWTRRAAHVLASLFGLHMASVLQPLVFITFCILFQAIIGFSYRRNFFSSIHNVQRKTYGELLLPTGILTAYLICGGATPSYLATLLILTLCDPLAGIIGSMQSAEHKTNLGSTVFFLSSWVILWWVFPAQSTLLTVLLALALTLVERLSGWGSDNFTLPLAASLFLTAPLHTWLQVVSLVLPLLISGLALILCLKLHLFESLNKPVDGYRFWGQARLFGDNKTYRGIGVHLVVAIAVCFALQVASASPLAAYIHPVFRNSAWLMGCIYSLSYSLGELANSAVKRQLDILPGTVTSSRYRWVQEVADLADGIVLTGLALMLFASVPLLQAIAAVLLGIALHDGTDVLMRRLRLKRNGSAAAQAALVHERKNAQSDSRFDQEPGRTSAMLANFKTLPNQLSALRLLMLPFLWILALAHQSFWLGVGILIALLTDLVDGKLARRWHQVTAFGSQLDSLADNLLQPSALVWLWILQPQLFSQHGLLIGLPILIYAASLTVGWVKFHRFGNLHLYSARAAAYVQGVFIVHTFLFNGYNEVLFYLAFGLFILESSEGLLLLLTHVEVNEHMGSILLSWRKRQMRDAGQVAGS